jgi:hypothetical protein
MITVLPDRAEHVLWVFAGIFLAFSIDMNIRVHFTRW